MPSVTLTARRAVLLITLAAIAGWIGSPGWAWADQTTAFAAAGTTVINNPPDWVPNPIGGNAEGAPNNFCVASSTPTGDWIEVRFSFPVAISDPITGIQVRVKLFAVEDQPALRNDVQLIHGGLVGVSKKIPGHLTTASCDQSAFVSAGGPGDLWGTALTAADFNSGTVGVRLTQVSPTVDIDAFEMTVFYGNSAPTANAGGPYSVNEGASVTLSGAGSSDPDGDALTYEWDLDDNGTFETPGISPTFSAASIDGPATPATRTVHLRVTDPDGASSTASATVSVLNVAPSVAASNAVVTVNEGSTATNTGTFSDPAPADVVTIGASTGTVVQGAGTWSWSRPAGDGPATLLVTITAQDDDGGSSSTSFTVEVLNLPPVINSVTNSGPIAEGGSATISVSATDPGGDPLTYTYHCGNGTPPFVSGSSAVCTYGDNGSYTVTVEVADDDGGVSVASTVVAVANVAPTPVLDTAGAVSFPGGDAFLGRQGVEQSHSAQASDPGSDDLTFSWFGGGAVHTHFNNGVSADSPLSPGGIFPFTAADAATVVFTGPGLYAVTVDVADDDGGVASDSFPKLVTGDTDCSRSQGFWRHQFLHDSQHVSDATLQAYLDLVGFASSVFSELVPASTLPEAAAVFDPTKGPGNAMRAKAAQQALAAWLNFASGAVALDELIDTDRDGVPETPLLALLQTVEGILVDPGASQAALVQAKDWAEAVNLLDEGTPACR